jgi:3-keto-5-aminohexanoate cleavage enzyme
MQADEIAADVRRCADAGAAIFHVHARDKDQKPTLAIEYLANIVKETGVKFPGVFWEGE